MSKSIFYNLNKTKSYNALFNFELGERGVGKTYGWMKDVIKNFLNKDEEFVYLRRYDTELKNSYSKVMKPLISNHEFDEHSLSAQKKRFYCDGTTMGYALALSNASTLKSTSFERVKTIIFDEFLLGNGYSHYLKNEVVQFLELYETIARLREVRAVFLGNATSSYNPYFDYFKLKIDRDKEYQLSNNGSILVHYIYNEAYRAEKKASKFGKLIAGTRYEEYAVDNKWLLDETNFIGDRPAHAVYLFSVLCSGHTVGVWADRKNNYLYLSKQYDKNAHRDWTVQPDYVSDDIRLIKKGNLLARQLNSFFELGRLICEDQAVRNYLVDILSYL